MITFTPIKLGTLTENDIGIPLLYANKAEREYGILTKIRDDDKLEIHFGRNAFSLVAKYEQLFKIRI